MPSSRPPENGSRRRRFKPGPRPDPARATAAAAPWPRATRERGERWVYGRHAVRAALANPERAWRRLVVLAEQGPEAEMLSETARARHRGTAEPVQALDRAALAALLPDGAVHQGWALEVEPLVPPDLDDVIRTAEIAKGRTTVLVLDQVTDPHNVGAVLRSAAAFGASAVILAEHAAPPASGVLAKAASGALDIVPLVRVVNLARALDRLKEAGFWCCGLDAEAPQPLAALDLGQRAVLVLGSEGGGLRRLVRERCDYLARLPTRPELPSLNVSNAAAIALYELARDKNG